MNNIMSSKIYDRNGNKTLGNGCFISTIYEEYVKHDGESR